MSIERDQLFKTVAALVKTVHERNQLKKSKGEDSLPEPIEVHLPIEVLKSTFYAHTLIQRVEVTLPDQQKTLATILHVEPSAECSLVIDQRFLDRPIALDNQRLISQSETSKQWGNEVPGELPESLLAKTVDTNTEAYGLHPTNAGWQTGAFWIQGGEIVLLQNDQEKLSGSFQVLTQTSKGWETRTIELQTGHVVNSADLAEIRTGFSLPLLIDKDKKNDVLQIISDPRFLADLRNVFDFAAGKKLPNEFWQTLRKLLPENVVASKRLLTHRMIVQRANSEVAPAELERFQQVLEEHGLDNYLCIDTKYSRPRLLIKQPLPLNRIPCFGIGHDHNNQLVIVAVDGRQAGMAGMTIEELAQLMKQSGIVSGGLGSAGGDVAVVTSDGQFLNSPANRRDNLAVTRPVPSILVIQ